MLNHLGLQSGFLPCLRILTLVNTNANVTVNINSTWNEIKTNTKFNQKKYLKCWVMQKFDLININFYTYTHAATFLKKCNHWTLILRTTTLLICHHLNINRNIIKNNTRTNWNYWTINIALKSHNCKTIEAKVKILNVSHPRPRLKRLGR